MVSDSGDGSNWRDGFAAKLKSLFQWGKTKATWIVVSIAIVIATGTIIWGIGYGLSQEIAYEQSAGQGHADYSKYGCNQIAKAQSQTIPVEQSDGKPCTPSEEAQKENDNRRDYADLVAQRSSALWAKIMGIAALIGMGLSLVGVALVWTTFRETRKANEISKASQRPWLDARIKLHGIAKTASGYALRIEVIIENVGSTPANHIRCAVDGFFLHDELNDDFFEFGEARKTRVKAIRSAVQRVKSTNSLSEREGLTIFPNAEDSIFIEEVIAVKSHKTDFIAVAWLVVELKYSIGHRDASSIRVFIVKSFGLPNETGFDTIGDHGDTYTDTDAKIDVWAEGGYAD